MRLTLRTLLAYLDDQLDSAAARELGQKLAETPAAQELVSRIREVTRRRRLSAPPVTGDEVEPDELAEYIDSLLGPDDVAKIERVCLDSDVHLAEVAACHQILTMIGQPAHVTPETRRRMYELVHAIESIPAERRRAMRKSEPASPPIFPRGPVMARLRRVAFFALCAVGISVLVWISINWAGGRGRDANPVELANDPFIPTELSPDPSPPPPTDTASPESEKPTSPDAAEPSQVADSATPAEPKATPKEMNETPTEPAATTPPPTRDDAAPAVAETPPKPETDSEKPAEPPAVAIPVATYASTSGVLMRLAPGNKDWRRLVARSPVAPGESLLCLPFQRAALHLVSGATVELVGETELAVVTPDEEGITAHLKLGRGRIVLGANQPNAAFRVDFHDESWRIQLKGAENEVALSVASVWRPGGPFPHEAVLYVPRGEVEFQTATHAATLGGPVQIRWSSAGGLREKESLAGPPAWMEKEEMTPFQIRAAAAIDQAVPKEASPVLSLIEATGSDRKEQRVIALRSLGAIGRLPPLIDAMNTPDKRDVRQEAIATLRLFLARGQDQNDALADALAAKLSKDREGGGVMQLLRGLTDAEAKEKVAYEALIKLLSPVQAPELGIRELAIMNLEELAGKLENVGYSPDKPSDAAIAAWRKELNSHRLPPRERGKM